MPNHAEAGAAEGFVLLIFGIEEERAAGDGLGACSGIALGADG